MSNDKGKKESLLITEVSSRFYAAPERQRGAELPKDKRRILICRKQGCSVTSEGSDREIHYKRWSPVKPSSEPDSYLSLALEQSSRHATTRY
jgi:hypothetical protein